MRWREDLGSEGFFRDDLDLIGGAGLNESFSGFENIGHNDPLSLLFLWIIPK